MRVGFLRFSPMGKESVSKLIHEGKQGVSEPRAVATGSGSLLESITKKGLKRPGRNEFCGSSWSGRYRSRFWHRL